MSSSEMPASQMSTIPKVIYQSWKTKKLPEKMEENVRKLRELNPEYEYKFYDDEDCKQFLLQNFGQNYANAFDALVPGAFKCDFWRYAILYLHGGVYLDMDMIPLKPFREMIPEDVSFVSVVDRDIIGVPGIYQAFIATAPNSDILKYALLLCFSNIATRKSVLPGTLMDVLGITGPVLFATAMNLAWNKKNTYESIKYGRKGDILLYRFDGEYVIDSREEKLILCKFEGYSSDGYISLKAYYHQDPRRKTFRIIMIAILAIICIAILGLVGSYVYRKKFHKCVSTCSSRE